MRSVLRWIDEETGLVTIIRHFLEEPLPKGVGWPHVFGSLVLFLFTLQLLTGLFMMIYYVPAPDHAYDSIEYIQSLAFGRIVRGLHHFGASAMVIFVGVHMVQAWLWGAYKKPRQVIWVIGVFLMLLTFAFSFTGYLLPWDQKAYWATVVGTNIAGSIPVIGEAIKQILRGGTDVGAATLTRFFAIHVFLLPGLITAGIIFHIYQLRKKGITPPWSRVGEEPSEKPVLFYPDQVFKDLVAALVVLMILLFLAVHFGAPLEERANPSDTTYVPRPEWYFLPIFEILKHLPGRYGEFTGAILIPSLGIILLLLFPYIDRNPERHPLKRPFATGLALFVFTVTTVFGVQGLRSMPFPKKLTFIEARGEKIFMDLRCSACHGVNGGGGTAGPDLATLENRNPQRLEALLRNPQAFNPRSIMPYYNLKEEEMLALVAYLRALGPGSRMPRVPQIGPKKPSSHFEENWMLEHKFEVRKDPAQCSACHKQRFCQTCHQNRRPDSHLHGWIKAHFGTATEKPEYCAACHNQSYCLNCHKDVLHTPTWITDHARGSKVRPQICQECHDRKTFCISCHKGAEPKSHTPNWLSTHGSQIQAGREREEACFTCHEPASCNSCHRGAKPKSHQAENFMEAHGGLSRQNPQACAQCHNQPSFCDNCHQMPMPHPPSFTRRTVPQKVSWPGIRPVVSSLTVYLSPHSRMAQEKRELCNRCHQPSECQHCHQLPMPHPSNFLAGHSSLALKQPGVCQKCHTEQYCQHCHGTKMPHPPDFAQNHPRASFSSNSVCWRCHKPNYCQLCHERR